MSPLRARRPATSCPCSGLASSPSGRSGPGSTVSATRASAALKARTSAARRRSAALLASAADSSHLNVRFVMPGRCSGASLNNAVREELISRNVAALIRGKTWTSQARNLRSGGRYNASTVSYSIGRPRPEASDAPLPLVPREGRLSRATSTGASPPLARARRSPACGHAGA